MSIQRWTPSTTTTAQEKLLLGRLTRHRRLFAFLREHRHELFDDALLDALGEMYRQSGAGKTPVCPGLMAMAMLLQGYERVSDAEAVERTVIDLRWQLVLGVLGSDKPAFSQGAFQEFRQRIIRADLDQRLLERTVALARETGAFDYTKLPKTLRVAMDSMPLEGAGRVEDTINLLAHAGRKVVSCAARLLDISPEELCGKAGAPLLDASSVKAALDRTWSSADDRHQAVTELVEQLARLEKWLGKKLPDSVKAPPLREHLATVHQIIDQDLEPDPSGGGQRIRDGVAPDRRVSIEDKEMRHGRKSKSKRFNGFKRHIALDLDTGLTLACALAAANRPEEDAAADLAADMKYLGRQIATLYIDRGYINAPLVDQVANDNAGNIVCRPWSARNGQHFAKSLFQINIRNRTITCPEGQTERFAFGTTVEFDAEVCDRCPSRSRCTDASPGRGRTVAISQNEARQKKLQRQLATPSGRRKLRERVAVEHQLAHAGRRQGRRGRYFGVRKNLFDWRRANAVTNLETIHRQLSPMPTHRSARKVA
jgi:hypothetical protein